MKSITKLENILKELNEVLNDPSLSKLEAEKTINLIKGVYDLILILKVNRKWDFY